MAKNTKQIALIQHRRGKLSELPTQLNEAEFGLATDTNELFIGNPTNPALAERIEANIFPYGNIQVLTEFTENLKKITYTYKSNTDVIARLPVVVYGNITSPTVAPNTSIYINSTEVRFNYSASLNKIVEIINATPDLNVKAFIHNNSFLGLISTSTEIVLEDGETYGKGCIERFGFGTDNFYSASSALPPERTLQSVLDDRCSIKNYGAFGDGVADDSSAIYNAIISLNKAGEDPKYYRTLFFPAGTYLMTSSVIPLPYGAYLKGEGIGRTVIKSKDYLDAIMVTMDSNMNMGTATEYGLNAELPSHITVEDLTIDVSDSITSSLLLLATCHNVLFKNVEFIGRDITNLVRIADNSHSQNSSHIVFDGCIFNTGETAINSIHSVEHLIVKNCLFRNIKNEAITLNPNEGFEAINTIIDGNMFVDCSTLVESIIKLGKNTQYVSVINNKFNKEVTTGVSELKPYVSESELNYTDILDPETNDKKILQFKFTQPVWEFIDYLMNPNGEYLLKSVYNYLSINGENIVKPLTNGLIIEQGDETNENTVTIGGSTYSNDVNINAGAYGKLHLGKNIKSTMYNNREYGKQYVVGDRVQYQVTDTFEIYECIKEHVADMENDVMNTEYWVLVGTFNPAVVFDKNIDLNGSSILDTAENITFKTTNDNIIIVDDVDPSVKYADRIGSNENALTNVDYVNRVAQTSVRNTVDNDSINFNPSNQLELVYFDPNKYGDIINLSNISINVRRPYYPMADKINENSLEWKTGLQYYVGDVIKIHMDNPYATELKLCVADSNLNWVEYPFENILQPQGEELDGNGEPLDSYGTNGDYAVIFGGEEENYQKFVYYKTNDSWYLVGEDYWKDAFNSFAVGKPDTTYEIESIISIDGQEITLTGTTVDEAVADINAVFVDGSVVASNENGALKLNKVSGKLHYEDIQYGAFEAMGFPIDEDLNEFLCVQPSYTITYVNEEPEAIREGDVWVYIDGVIYYYACTKDHIASDSFEVDAGMTVTTYNYIGNVEKIDDLPVAGNEKLDGYYVEEAMAVYVWDGNGWYVYEEDQAEKAKWQEVFKQGIDINTKEIVDLPDVKYVSIMATNHVDAKRLLLKRNAVDVSKRDINSKYEKEWVNGIEYMAGERCLFKNRYYECLKNHTSSSEYDLNTPELWMAVPEEGYNYHFAFERNIYKLDENDNVVIDNDITIDYNFSGYYLYLEFYDANEKLLPMFNVINEPNAEDYRVQMNPSGYVSATINYVRGTSSEDTSNS